ncbi:MAG: response regulator [Gammaproteobacteria bacterium]
MIHNPAQLKQHDKQETLQPVCTRLQGRILLAEEKGNIQKLLSLYLENMGLQVTHAETGAVAVRLASDRAPDLIMMDIQMTVLSGLDAVRQIRANAYKGPVIALTARATSEDRRQCLQAGCNDFLARPVTRQRLHQTLAKYLNQPVLPQIGVEPLVSELSGQGPDFVEIVRQFVNKLPEQLASIEMAYQENDREKLCEIVHNLKGMGGGFGYPQLTEKAIEIERCLNPDDNSSVGPLIASLQELMQRIQVAMPRCQSF